LRASISMACKRQLRAIPEQVALLNESRHVLDE
jgi:hypothetical protein